LRGDCAGVAILGFLAVAVGALNSWLHDSAFIDHDLGVWIGLGGLGGLIVGFMGVRILGKRLKKAKEEEHRQYREREHEIIHRKKD
jgi:hypothetical protein